ncbi:peptidoglycan DD-metalloendopeptidase family protein [Ruminococcaceae bacterium OttesenSCG-928-O06]|nr:peptidoglycan DD-metalloendopeptidase family protein [Ruminococcaceae bacterium OttesenSCG-928-O06]
MKKRGGKILALVCVLLLCFQFVPLDVAAREMQEVQQEIADKRAELNKIAEDIKKNENNKAYAEQQLAVFQQRYDELIVLIAEQQALLDKKGAELDLKVEELNETREHIRENTDAAVTRLRAIYDMNSTSAVLAAVLAVDSFTDFLVVTDGLQRVSQRDTQLLDTLEELQGRLDLQRADIEQHIANLAEEMDQLHAARAETEQNMQEMREVIVRSNANIQLKQEQQEQTEEEYRQLIAEMNEIMRKLNSNGSVAGDGSIRYSGAMVWPVPGHYRVSSVFGDPRSNTRSHYGIDIPAETGTSIVAAGDGTVLTAEWHYSYGYYLVLDHGQGLRTLYAHCSSLDVYVGQYVGAGDHIAKVGNTGNSYGAHLHIEVHESGVRQNPENPQYLGKPAY